MITQEQLVKLQQSELSILVDFDKFCQQNSLTYYLIGGALLGAKRYGKFIPWDDDVDVAMPREDYEKLQTLWLNSEQNDYFLQSEKTDKNFSRCILKLRKNGTQITEYTTQNVEMHQGIYIDIFPIDYVEEYDEKELDARAKKIRKLMTLRTIKSGYKSKRFSFVKKLINLFTCIISLESIDKKIESLCTKDNDKQRNYAVLFVHNYEWRKQIHKVAVFGAGARIDFCGHKINAPEDTDAFLRKVFGDEYMKEPETKKQPHNYVSVVFGEDK